MNINIIETTVLDGKRAYANWSTLELCEYMGELQAHHDWLDDRDKHGQPYLTDLDEMRDNPHDYLPYGY